MLKLVTKLHGRLREHAKRGTGITHKISQAVTGEGPRSPHWPTVEHRWKKSHPNCAACGSTQGIQVHHVQSFATHPQLELWDCSGVPPGTGPVGGTPNFISLCEEGIGDAKHHHLEIGHGGSFAHGGYNPNVVKDSADFKADPSKAEDIYARAKTARISPEVKNAG